MRGIGWGGAAGLILVTLLVLTALLGPLLPLPNPVRGDLRARMIPPTLSLDGPGAHPLGTDQLGRDILSRIVAGSQVTLGVAAGAVVLGGVVGVLLGLVAGYFGGWTDRLLMRVSSAAACWPSESGSSSSPPVRSPQVPSASCFCTSSRTC